MGKENGRTDGSDETDETDETDEDGIWDRSYDILFFIGCFFGIQHRTHDLTHTHQTKRSTKPHHSHQPLNQPPPRLSTYLIPIPRNGIMTYIFNGSIKQLCFFAYCFFAFRFLLLLLNFILLASLHLSECFVLLYCLLTTCCFLILLSQSLLSLGLHNNFAFCFTFLLMRCWRL